MSGNTTRAVAIIAMAIQTSMSLGSIAMVALPVGVDRVITWLIGLRGL
jgi:hypothetical protein